MRASRRVDPDINIHWKIRRGLLGLHRAPKPIRRQQHFANSTKDQHGRDYSAAVTNGFTKSNFKQLPSSVTSRYNWPMNRCFSGASAHKSQSGPLDGVQKHMVNCRFATMRTNGADVTRNCITLAQQFDAKTLYHHRCWSKLAATYCTHAGVGTGITWITAHPSDISYLLKTGENIREDLLQWP